MSELRLDYRPALVAPGYEARMAAALVAAPRFEASAPAKSAIHVGYAGGKGDRLYPIRDGIALIGVYGVLLDKFPWVGCSWATGYDALRCQFAQAFADPEVKAIALDIDSGGGMVSGCFDLVDWIVAEKSRAGKPIGGILSECAYSAAYAIASAADRIAVPRTGGVGSIGVVMMHVDMSGLLEQWGYDVTLIHSGKHKVDGHPFAPLPAEVKASFQAECDELRRMFAETVARNRGEAGLTVKVALGTEARIFSGPEQLAEAVKIGLADEILPPTEAFARMVKDMAAA